MLWLWCRPVGTAPIHSLAWEFPYATDAALRRPKKKKRVIFHRTVEGIAPLVLQLLRLQFRNLMAFFILGPLKVSLSASVSLSC